MTSLTAPHMIPWWVPVANTMPVAWRRRTTLDTPGLHTNRSAEHNREATAPAHHGQHHHPRPLRHVSVVRIICRVQHGSAQLSGRTQEFGNPVEQNGRRMGEIMAAGGGGCCRRCWPAEPAEEERAQAQHKPREKSGVTKWEEEEEEEEEKEKEKEVGKSHRGGRCCSAAWPTFADAAALVGGLTVALGRRRTATQPSSGPSWLGHPHAQRDNCCGCCCPPIFGRNGNGVVIVFRRLHDPIVSILVLFNGVRAADRHLAVLALPEPAGTASHGSAKEIQEGTGGGGEGSPFSLVG